jgi:hypothetical protein
MSFPTTVITFTTASPAQFGVGRLRLDRGGGGSRGGRQRVLATLTRRARLGLVLLLMLLGLWAPRMLLPLLQLDIVTIKKPGFFLPGGEHRWNGFQTIAAGEDPCRETLFENLHECSIIETGEALVLLESDDIVVDRLTTLLDLLYFESRHRDTI